MSLTEEYYAAKKKKKKEEEQSSSKISAPLYVNKTAALYNSDIAPVRTMSKKTESTSKKKDDDKDRKWFQKGAFEDGYDFGDVTKTILATGTDIRENLVAGVLGMGEAVVDAGAYVAGGVGKLFGADKFADKTKKFIAKDLYDEEKVAKKIISGVGETFRVDTEENSLFGEKSDALVQSGGQLAATVGLQAVGVPWFVTTGVTSFGREAEAAFNEDATYLEAGLSGVITAGAEMLTEKISGGIKFGGKALDDVVTKRIARGVSNKVVRTLLKLGVDATGEGFEEVLSGTMSALGQKITYGDDKELTELFSKEEALESFIGGAVLGGGFGVVNNVQSKIRGFDYTTGLTANEQKVVDKEYESRIAEAEQDGELSKKDKDKIYDEVLRDLEEGGISTDTIEEVLGGETYNTYKETIDNEDALRKEYEELGAKQNATLAEQTRYNELHEQIKGMDNTARDNLKTQLGDEVFNLVKNDRLAESYYERGRRGQAFEADVTQYDEKQRQTIQNAIDSGILNNTRRTHEFVDMIAKISADKGVPFNFTDNAKLKETGFAIEGKTVNGFVTKDGVTLNINSAKALNSVVGHEITHVLEGTEFYDALQETVFNYAKTKGEYDSKLAELTDTYKGMDADVSKELTADLVGDYLFTDTDFIKHLSVNNRNVFQKIYDEIKYLCKVATAGSKEARELAKMQKAFADVYRESGKQQGYVTNSDAFAPVNETAQNPAVQVEAINPDNLGDLTYMDIETYNDFFSQEEEALHNIFKDRVATQEGKVTKKDKERIFNEIMRDVRNGGISLQNTGDTKYSVSDKNIKDVSTGYASGETYYTMAYTQDGKVVGTLEYGEYDGAPNVKMVEVNPNYRRQGIGKKLLQELQKKYPNTEIDFGMSTPDGTKLIDAVTYTQTDEKVAEGKRKLRELQTELVDVERRLNELYDLEELTAEQEQEVAQLGERWDQLYYTDIRNLQEEYGDKAESKRFVKYSISDNSGKTLTKGQQEYFKDSKVRDENGSLMVMYHGTPNGDHTVFKEGTYFTDNKEYADRYQNTSASSIKSGKVATNPKTFAVYLDIKKPFDIADAEARNIYINEYIKGGNAIGVNPYLSDAEYENIKTIDWTEGEDLRDFLMENGYDYDGIVLDEGADGGYGEDVSYRGKSYMIFNSEQAKSIDNANPTSNPDIRYSVSDSDGKKLTKGQIEYFKDSKMRDDNGNLMVMYHGSRDAGFHVFDADMSDDGTSFFFVDRNDVAASYSGTTETYEAKTIRNAEDMNNFLAEIGQDEDYSVTEQDGQFILLYDGERVAASDTAQGIYKEFCWYEGVGEGDANYKVYLNLKNPLVVDAEGRNWNRIPTEPSKEVYNKYKSLTDAEKAALVDLTEWEDWWLFKDEVEAARKRATNGEQDALSSAITKLMDGQDNFDIYNLFSVASDNFSEEAIAANAYEYLTTRDYAQRAKEQGYDGVIFKNIHDNGGYSNGSEGASTVAVAFDSNQIKSVANENPTADKDIRYSITEYTEAEKKAHNDMVLEHFGKTYSWAETGYVLRDGTKLDLSGKHEGAPGGYRSVDHRDIVDALGSDYGDGSYSGALVQFMSEGNIRISPESNGINLSVKPTKAQEQALADFISRHRGEVILDIDEADGYTVVSVEYPYGTYFKKVLDDIRGWFENGTKPDAQYSLSRKGEAPIKRRGLTYGEDVALAPTEQVAENTTVAEPKMETPVQDISPIDESLIADDGNAYSAETLGELEYLQNRARELQEQAAQFVNEGLTKDKEADYLKVAKEYQAIKRRMDELEAQTATTEEDAVFDSDRLASLDDADMPIQQQANPDMRGNQIPLDEKTVKLIANNVKTELGLNNKQTAEARKLIEKYSMQEFPSREELFKEVKEKIGFYIEENTDEHIRDAKAWIRKTPIFVDGNIKGDIADYDSWMHGNFGKIRFSKNGLPVDVAYQEMNSMYPNLFPEDVINPTDQLMQMAEVASMKHKVKTMMPIDDDILWGVTDDIIEYIGAYQHSQKQAVAEEQAGESFDSLMDDIAPVPETAQPVPETASTPNVEQKPETQKVVKEKIAKKIENFQKELENNLRKREEANRDFDEEIAKLQAEYDGKKDKHTATANDILRRIERKRRMKANVDADYANRISNLEERIEKMGTPVYQRAAQRMSKQQEYTSLMENLVGDTTHWVDKKLGIYYKTNTLHRNLRDVVRKADGSRDIEKADAIYDELQGKYNHNEAMLKRESRRIKNPYAELKITKAEDVYIQMLGELRHNPDTKLSGETVEEFYKKHKNRIDTDKVAKVIADARKTYDELLIRVNKLLKEQGMKEIPYRKGYFPHFTDEKQGFLAKLFNWKTRNNDIPTDIAGLTEAFNPNRSWQPFNKQRKGDTTDYSFTKGLDAYVHGALDWIYHIEDIQKRRAFENYIRYVHSETGVKERIDAIRANEEYDADEMQEQIDLVWAEAKNPLNNFVTDLRAGTNTLANKKSSMDRGMEEATNRKIYSTMTNISNRVSANMVAGSISSALTNFIPITQSWGQVSPVSSLRAMGSTIASAVRDDGVIDKSDFLTNRLRQEENLYKTGWDKASDVATVPMEVIDSFTSQVVWRSKYIENIANGMSENEAIKNADQFAENVMAGRSRGNQPTIFDSKNPLIKMLTAFQLEVNNQYGYMFKDMPQDMRNESVFKLAKGYATMFIGAYAYNALFSALTGRNAAFDPIRIVEELLRDLGVFGGDDEEEEDIFGAIENLGSNILEDTPFVGGILGGGRVPISAMFPYGGIGEAYTGMKSDIENKNWENLTAEWMNPVYYLALPFGGGQIKKTVQGLSMFSEDHPISGSYTKSGNLRFPVEDTFGNRVQAGLFGQWASDNARYYFDNEISPLKEKQIQEFIDAEMPIRDYWDYRKGLNEQEDLEAKFEYINGLDLTDEQKNILINNVVDRKEDVDISNYDDFSSYEEFDFYAKNTEKYNFLQENGISYSTYNASEDSRDRYNSVYSWYKRYSEEAPGKITLGKAVCDNLIEYRDYVSTANDFDATDENGETVRGLKKERATEYIFGLDLDYGQKVLLYRSMYDSNADKEEYNDDILEYLNSREDLTYEERVEILLELDFTVDENGYATW